jgi:hypothetical protein
MPGTRAARATLSLFPRRRGAYRSSAGSANAIPLDQSGISSTNERVSVLIRGLPHLIRPMMAVLCHELLIPGYTPILRNAYVTSKVFSLDGGVFPR